MCPQIVPIGAAPGIAKAEFQNQLARYCDMQGEHPQHRAMHSAANLAYADYHQRMIDTGGSLARARRLPCCPCRRCRRG